MNYTVQLLEEQHNGYEDWQTYAVRDQHNHCVCIVGAVDHATANTNRETAIRIARALSHNCSNAFCTIREDDYPDVLIFPAPSQCSYCGNRERHKASNTCALCGRLWS